jgi:uncharacterized protein
MYFSRFNIFSKLRDSENYFILNLLSGNADILSSEEAEDIIEKKYSRRKELEKKGYLVDEVREQKNYRSKYRQFLTDRMNSEIQIFFVPTYACNFSCSYCYQRDYRVEKMDGGREVIDGFFQYMDREFSRRKKYITLFGGEPLLPGAEIEEKIGYILRKAKSRDTDTAIVTNGYHLADYIGVLGEGNVREVQVTLDGTAETHDSRRTLKDGAGTFSSIVYGIDRALEAGYPINLRVVLDDDNMENFPNLAEYAIARGWTKRENFKTQLGRNYELHACQEDNTRLFSRVEFYQKIYDLFVKYPWIGEFHRPAFSLSRFLFENGELPRPLFDSCPACKTEWAFDHTGRIYPCTATVGKVDESLGTYYPAISKKDELIETWRSRDVTVIPECRECGLQLSCGGGCGAVAKNRTGKLLSSDCRPEKRLMEMGISLYFEKGVQYVGQNNLCQCC